MLDVVPNFFRMLIFPGLIFTLIIGLTATWVVRKVSALVQWRVGPPFMQPFYDVGKLMTKEILVPREAQQLIFMGAPVVGFAAVLLLATLLWQTALSQSAFVGDVIVALYLMVLPSLALILGASASGSPHAALGAGREMKLVLSYELPLVLALVVVLIKTAPALESADRLSLAALATQTPVASISGFLAFVAALFCVQAKLGFVPFDIAESETEIAGGLIMEYSGVLLALWKLMQAMMLVALPLFLITLFLGGFHVTGWHLADSVGKYILVLVLLILIKNTNPRVRIDQALRFFWFYCGIPLVLAVILASLGNVYKIPWL